jgi:predicted nucleotidyltransferase
MYLTETQFEVLRNWAQQTPQIQEAYLFGSYAKGEAHVGSDVDIAIRVSAVDWTFRTAKWEEYLTKAIGVKVNIRTLTLPNVRRYCHEFSVPLKVK